METSHFVERKRDFIAHLKKVLYDGAFTYHLLVWDIVDTLHNNNMYAEGKWGRISRAR